jgi:hypothetical protein
LGSAVRVELRQAPFQEAPFGVGVDELERAVVSGAGVLDAIEPAQQLGAGAWRQW